MLEQRIAELIQAEVDGELPAAERAELASILERSAEARGFRDDMQKVARLLSAVPAVEPPAGLRQRVLNRIQLPRRVGWLELGAAWLRPASYGLAVAAGVLLAVGVERFESSTGSADIEKLVGTMVQRGAGATLPGPAAGQLLLGSAGLHGQVVLKALDDQSLAMEFTLDTMQPVELTVDFSAAGLQFGGFAETSQGVDAFEVADGRVWMKADGHREFVVFLRRSGESVSGAIGVEVSQQGERVFQGSLESRSRAG